MVENVSLVWCGVASVNVPDLNIFSAYPHYHQVLVLAYTQYVALDGECKDIVTYANHALLKFEKCLILFEIFIFKSQSIPKRPSDLFPAPLYS